ncbi:MAG: rhodanese-like domain-containing protein [Paludibacteraceae bacterium]|nr:rhodanese-like domain-containing protein [Paludibacteraceae bacterium]
MKRLRNYFVMLTVAIMALFCTSCGGGDDSEELGSFVEYTEADTFYETYTSYTGSKALIDTREKSKFVAGHLPGAVNMPADIYNTADDDAQWSKDLLAAYPTNTCLFFYGTTSFQMTKAVAGRASRIGYGKQNSRIFSKGYDELKTVWK